MKNVLISIGIILLLILGVVVVRTLLHSPIPFSDITPADTILDENKLARHLSEAITFETVSFQTMDQKKPEEFTKFIAWVKNTYPELNRDLELKMLNETMLYKWQGTDSTLQPVLLTGHYDVVPVIPGSESMWVHPPFSGSIVDGVIWGRGALDDKSGVIGILEAVTYLISQGHTPTRTVYLSLGHDEEIGGTNGAGEVARFLRESDVQLAWSLDEGSFVLNGIFPGLETMVAAINVAEKGSVTLDITATAAGGHSSMPPKDNAVGMLAKAIVALEENPLPGGLEGISAEMFHEISRYLPFGMKMLFANQWLFGSLIDQQLSQVATTNAMLRTTTAPTMLSGSIKTNVLPIEAVATVNFRIHPRDTPDSIKAHVERVSGGKNITVSSRGGRGASEVSDWNAEGFQLISKSVREVYGEVAVTPGLMVAASDSRHYGKVADNAYRFNPFVVGQEDIAGFHGTNENMKVAAFAEGVRSYIQIIRHGSAN